MGRKPPVDRLSEEKWQIVQEGIKSESPHHLHTQFALRRVGGPAGIVLILSSAGCL
jgi:hypothetical protein